MSETIGKQNRRSLIGVCAVCGWALPGPGDLNRTTQPDVKKDRREDANGKNKKKRKKKKDQELQKGF